MITVPTPCLRDSFGLPECTQTAWVYWLLRHEPALQRLKAELRTFNTHTHTQVKLPASVLVTQHLTDQRASPSPKCSRALSCNTPSSITGSQKSPECIHLLLRGIIESSPVSRPLNPLSPRLCVIVKDSWRMEEWPCSYFPGEKWCTPPQFREVLRACYHPSSKDLHASPRLLQPQQVSLSFYMKMMTRVMWTNS